MAGWFSVNGDPESGPVRVGVPLVDIGTGLFAAIAVLMALIERGRSGRGQFLDMTLFDCAVSLMHPHVANYYLSGGKVPGLTGNHHPNVSPYDKFKTRTGEIFLGAGNNRAFQRLCRELGRPELAGDPRFRDNSGRLEHREALRAELEAALAGVDGEALCRRLLAAGLPAGPVLDTARVMNHPHTLHRGMAAAVDWYRNAGLPIKFSRTPGAIRRLPPRFSEDGAEILAEIGYSREEVERLADCGAFVPTRRKT